MGTTALGLVLAAAMPVQVVGALHYFHMYHHLVSTAAPIYDVHGRITGILAIVRPVSTATSHTFSLVMAAARAVSNQLQAGLYLEEANRRLTEVNAVLRTMHEGVIAWDEAGKIRHVNPQAGTILQLYYAFGGFNFFIPPLRERVEDIPLLAERFFSRTTKDHQNPHLGEDVHSTAHILSFFDEGIVA